MAPFGFYLSITVLFIQSTVGFNCSDKKWVYVDIHKRAVHGSSIFQYGSFIGLGTPAQNHSLWPSLSQNHTSFAASDYCDNSTLSQCDRSTGGFFNRQDSTSFVEELTFKSLDQPENALFSGFAGQDKLRLYTHYFETDAATQTLVENSTVLVAEEGSITPGRVGIGSSSTLLKDLAAKGIIAAKTYSLYIGQGFDRAGGVVNGSNVFGGYDSGRFTGTPHRYPMNMAKANPMSVRIKDILITNTQDNKNISLFDNTLPPDSGSGSKPPREAAFEAEITTEQFPLSLPHQVTSNFIHHLDAMPNNYWGDNSLKLDRPAPTGTQLTIILSDGFTITLPSELLSNASNITPIQSRPANATTPFYLGTAFLTQLYLMADFESHAFFLAPAVQKNNLVMPQTFCPNTTPVAYVRPRQSPWQRQGLIGAVIGGLIGGLGVLAALFCAWTACLRRKDERRLKRELEANQARKMQRFEVEEGTWAFQAPPKAGNAVSAPSKPKGVIWRKYW